MSRPGYSGARIQECPWHSGKTVRMIELGPDGRPSRADQAFAKANGLIITAREPQCGGVRIYHNGGWR